MSAVYPCFIGQNEKLFTHGFQESLCRRTWKIRPANGFSKECVAAENTIFHAVTYAAWGMPGRMENGELHGADF